jgi:alkylation response protein AidB-like acyl-CoA dehydrogenase
MSQVLDRTRNGVDTHASASLGIAESAASAIAGTLAARGEPDPRARTLLAQNVVDLGASRATLARSAALVDVSDEDAPALFAETQAAKTFVNEASARIVDRALGRSGLPQRPPARPRLSRRPRGGFMHPLGANRAYDLLGDAALGRELVLH